MNLPRAKFHTYFRGIILIGLSLFFLKLLLTGKISYFISPKLYPFLSITIGILIIVGIIQIFIGTSDDEEMLCDCCEEHQPPKTTFRSVTLYSLFIIPIISGFLFSTHTLGSSIAKNRQVQLTTSSQDIKQNIASNVVNKQETETNQQNNGSTDNTVPSSTQQQYMTQKEYDQLKQSMFQEKSIIIDDSKYVPTLGLMEDNLNELIGKEIETVGFVYREKDFPNDQIVVARFGITCCIADASVYGIMAKGDLAKFKNDTWVRLRGKLNKTTYDSTTIPVLNVTSVEEIKEPVQPYVYDIGIKVD